MLLHSSSAPRCAASSAAAQNARRHRSGPRGALNCAVALARPLPLLEGVSTRGLRPLPRPARCWPGDSGEPGVLP